MVRSAIDPIRPGASLILAWQIKHRHVVIIGGGFVAAGRLVNVLEADAKVTVICPEEEELSKTVQQHILDHPESTRLIRRAFRDSDLTTKFGEHTVAATSLSSMTPVSTSGTVTGLDLASSLTAHRNLQDRHGSDHSDYSSDDDTEHFSEPAVDMVLSAIDNIPLSTHIYNLSKRLSIPVNIADVPPQCDFYFCSTHRDKNLQVAVSTSGKGPKLANLIRRHIADHLPNRVGDAIEQVGILRAKLRKMAPGPEVGPKRMRWMSRFCEEWSMEDLAELNEQSIQIVLSGFKDDVVYSAEQVKEQQQLAQAQQEINISEIVTAPKVETVKARHSAKTEVEQTARLILVGAGPGDPDLLTRKAARLLEEADIVVADRLIPMEIIDIAKGEVRIAPKKRTSLPIESDQGSNAEVVSSDYIQDQLNEWCLQGLREGKTVVRLKQGDPFIFGRGAEEILFFRGHGFEAEIVPGISSALSAPSSALIPLTHRGSSDQVVITTAQAKGGVLPDNFPVYDAKKTVVILMGVGKAKEISELMQSSKLGWPADVPAVIVENAHCVGERSIDATLGTLAQIVEEHEAVPPAVFVIGWAGSVLRRA
ncbi:uroporphyrin-III C-methyltransferase [Dissophora globulifera]|uniref:precorrin-2 dehydrogenase n=1 Tax=Dissophora globulifera TaxID=979702 RepID=A0A9P6RT78_9FUNG|nr:uroporphyrin-III C-methyltransferase [Dissophora globulifera]